MGSSPSLDLAVGTPLSAVGCTCGSGEQLEAERLRLTSHSRCIEDRAEDLAAREACLQRREALAEDGWHELRCREGREAARFADVARQRETTAELLSEVAERGAAAERAEEELRALERNLEQLQGEVQRSEVEVADQELQVAAQRREVEDELEKADSEWSKWDSQLAALKQEHGTLTYVLHESRLEREVLQSDEQLLTEIEAQLGPVRQALRRKEQHLDAGELAAQAREADGEERARRLGPESERQREARASAEAWAAELRSRELETFKQRELLMQRQRSLGGDELRLRSLEGALHRHQQGEGVERRSGAPAEDERALAARLARLRAADERWANQLHSQQAEVQRLEAQLRGLEAGVPGAMSVAAH